MGSIPHDLGPLRDAIRGLKHRWERACDFLRKDSDPSVPSSDVNPWEPAAVEQDSWGNLTVGYRHWRLDLTMSEDYLAEPSRGSESKRE